MNFIKKINKYLVEHYPLIWNTRLVWMLGIALLLHVTFFIVGYNYVNTQEDIVAVTNLESFYYDTSVVFVAILLSIIILLVWIIYYLQNNAFKNLYTLKKDTLFTQFCVIFFIFFINTSQFYSFNAGLKLKIKNKFDWQEIDTDIKEFNKLSLFLLQTKSDYNIDNKKYPAPFPLEYSSVIYKHYKNHDISIDTTKSNFYHNNYYYQFYKLDKKRILEDSKKTNLVINKRNNFKYRTVFDVFKYKNLIDGSLLNYSKELYSYGQDSTDSKNRLKFYETLLNKKDEKEIEKTILPFFDLAKKYHVKHNLNKKDWLYLINTKNDYVLIERILNFKPGIEDKERFKSDYYRVVPKYDTVSLAKRKKKELFFLRNDPLTEDGKSAIVRRTEREYFSKIPYCDLGRLDIFFKNVHEAYNSNPSIKILYALIIITFIVSLLLFLFKLTNIKTLLLSFVSGSILLIIILLLIEYVSSYKQNYRNTSFLEICSFLLIGISITIASIISFIRRWKKLITAILFSLTLFIIPLLLVAMISLYEKYERSKYLYQDFHKNTFLIWFDAYGFWVVIGIWLLSIGLYTIPIRKWKGLPE